MDFPWSVLIVLVLGSILYTTKILDVLVIGPLTHIIVFLSNRMNSAYDRLSRDNKSLL